MPRKILATQLVGRFDLVGSIVGCWMQYSRLFASELSSTKELAHVHEGRHRRRPQLQPPRLNLKRVQMARQIIARVSNSWRAGSARYPISSSILGSTHSTYSGLGFFSTLSSPWPSTIPTGALASSLACHTGHLMGSRMQPFALISFAKANAPHSMPVGGAQGFHASTVTEIYGKFASMGCRLRLRGQVVRGEVPPEGLLALNSLRPNEGSTKDKRRKGRGIGSGRGKTSGRGQKGQYARGNGPRLGFEGGQTPLAIRTRKRGFSNAMHRCEYRYVNLHKIALWIDQGRLDASQLISMKELRDSGCIDKTVLTGVKLLGSGAKGFKHKIDIQVSKCSEDARAAIEAAGGRVTKVWYNQLGLRALFKPDWFPRKGRLLPRPVMHIPIKHTGKFDTVGQLPPTPLPGFVH